MNNPTPNTSFVFIQAEKIEDISNKLESILSLLSKDRSSSLGDYISQKEAQKLLDRKTTWFWSMRKNGYLPFSKVGNKIYYSKADIIKLLDKGKSQY